MNVKQIKELAGHRQVSPWVIKLVQDAIAVEVFHLENDIEQLQDQVNELLTERFFRERNS